jgi:pilus retraction protein PilT
VDVAGVHRELRLFEVAPGIRIAILNILGDTELVKAASSELAEKLRPREPDVLVTAESKSIPLAYELADQLGIPYIVLRKQYRSYMGDALEVETVSITTGHPQTLYLDEKDRGLVLCVGAAGNGKTSTLAAMLDYMNHNTARHIVTIEDPIEYIHTDDKCSISQREIGYDTHSFASALRAALRQDPDVIQVGEIRDAETMDIALKAAETGHLVLSTLHTPDVSRTMNRIIALSEGASDDLRERLGDVLLGIVAQRLLPRADGQGMALAAEVLVSTGSVRETIKRPLGNPSLKELMDSGQSMYGMQTFEAHIKALVQGGVLDREVGRAAMGY